MVQAGRERLAGQGTPGLARRAWGLSALVAGLCVCASVQGGAAFGTAPLAGARAPLAPAMGGPAGAHAVGRPPHLSFSIHSLIPSSALLPAGGSRFGVGLRMVEDGGAAEGNATDIYEKVGAAGNLRSGGTGFTPPKLKTEEPNYKVKPASDNPVLNAANRDGDAGKVFDDMQKKASFEHLVDFPCLFTVKVVGARQGEFMGDILDAVGGVVGREGADIEHSFRDNGKWRSITMQVPVESSDQLYSVYEAVGRDPRVKFKF